MREYILDVIRVSKVEGEWTDGVEFVEVYCRTCANGRIRYETKVFTKPEWENILERGYFNE